MRLLLSLLGFTLDVALDRNDEAPEPVEDPGQALSGGLTYSQPIGYAPPHPPPWDADFPDRL